MATHYSLTRKNFPISIRLILKRTVQAILLFIILLLALYFFGLFTFAFDFQIASFITGGLILILIFATVIYERTYFSTYFYDLTENYIIIKKGPIQPREITVPYDRIASVTIERGILDAIFGLCNLKINTENAPYLGMEAFIEGLTRQSANGLQGVLDLKIAETKQKSVKSEKNKG